MVSGKLSKLKYELQTDKMFEPITGDRKDVEHWNQFLEELEMNEEKSYFCAVWLHAECYLYRKIKSIFEES
jgi:damage-control phosphatase, subfamily III